MVKLNKITKVVLSEMAISNEMFSSCQSKLFELQENGHFPGGAEYNKIANSLHFYNERTFMGIDILKRYDNDKYSEDYYLELLYQYKEANKKKIIEETAKRYSNEIMELNLSLK